MKGDHNVNSLIPLHPYTKSSNLGESNQTKKSFKPIFKIMKATVRLTIAEMQMQNAKSVSCVRTQGTEKVSETTRKGYKGGKNRSAVLQVIAGHQTQASRLAENFGFPPAIVLLSGDSKNITLVEAELFRNLSLIHVHCTSCRGLLVTNSENKRYREEISYNNA